MASQSPTHGTLGGRSCFKCGTGLGQDGVRYLGHDWCTGCARDEAEVRLRRRISGSDSGNGGKPAAAAPLPNLPATMQSLLKTLPGTSDRDLRSALTAISAIGGPALLLVGLGVVLVSPAAIAGSTLTLSGAILMSAVVRRR